MLEQQEYQSEGIDITNIEFKDNKAILVRSFCTDTLKNIMWQFSTILDVSL